MSNLVVALLLWAALGCGNSPSQSNEPKGQAESQVDDWPYPVLKCYSGHEEAVVDDCLPKQITNRDRLVHSLKQFDNGQGYWWSIWLDTKEFKKRHGLGEPAINCLKQRFCKERKS